MALRVGSSEPTAHLLSWSAEAAARAPVPLTPCAGPCSRPRCTGHAFTHSCPFHFPVHGPRPCPSEALPVRSTRSRSDMRTAAASRPTSWRCELLCPAAGPAVPLPLPLPPARAGRFMCGTTTRWSHGPPSLAGARGRGRGDAVLLWPGGQRCRSSTKPKGRGPVQRFIPFWGRPGDVRPVWGGGGGGHRSPLGLGGGVRAPAPFGCTRRAGGGRGCRSAMEFGDPVFEWASLVRGLPSDPTPGTLWGGLAQGLGGWPWC